MSDTPVIDIVDIRGGVIFGSASQPTELVLACLDRELARVEFTKTADGAPLLWQVSIPPEVLSVGTTVLYLHMLKDKTPLAVVPLQIGPSDVTDISDRLAKLETEVSHTKALLRREKRKSW